ncbi:MAG: VOC family protein [Kofleriaceae bacterium]|nr:VOC family protein [Kofleriaceae bacterium]
MIDHIGITVTDLERSVAFYTKALAPLGYTLIMKFDGQAAGLGINGKPDFWIGQGPVSTKAHVAFVAKGRAGVRDFYTAAIAAGATDNGAPGVRAHYHQNYYGGFVLDPDGNNIEAVCHDAYLD